MRLRGGLLVVLVLLMVLAARLVWLQGVAAHADDALAQRRASFAVPAPRGEITDRSGQPIAMSIAARGIYGEPRLIAKSRCEPDAKRPCTPAAIAAELAPVLGLPQTEIEEKLRRDVGFVYLARGADPDLARRVRELDLVGIGSQPEPKRVHPGGDLAANIVGFTDADNKGAAGVELRWDGVLAGKDGKTSAEFDGKGRRIPSGETRVVEPVPGRNLRLTLDRDLQWEAQRAIAAKVKETEAESGVVITMDVRTGEVLALATSPTFNPDDRAGAPAKHFGNPAISEPYEPGSVVKIITAATALEAGVVTPATIQTVPDQIKVANRIIHDSHSHPTEKMTFTGVLVQSSNVGTIQVGQKLGPQRIYDGLRNFGFGEQTGINLPGESRGIVPKPEDWSGSSIGNIPIGQGVSATALQVASVYATVANGGVRVDPTVVKGIYDEEGRVVEAPAPKQRRVISEQTAAQLSAMLEGVVSAEGTAPLAAIPGYRVAGKTGTAQRVVNGRYQAGNYTSSFAGYAPADAPRLVTAVVLQGTGKQAYYGGAVAGPVFKDVMSFAMRGLAIPPTGTRPPELQLFAPGSGPKSAR